MASIAVFDLSHTTARVDNRYAVAKPRSSLLRRIHSPVAAMSWRQRVINRQIAQRTVKKGNDNPMRPQSNRDASRHQQSSQQGPLTFLPAPLRFFFHSS